MTLVLSVLGRDTLWLVVDRRLSYGRLRPPKEDGVKVARLETMDGVGYLAYAGLGATPRGTEPSAWMMAVLRGRGGMPFEATLGFLANAATRELPRHIKGIPGGSHSIVIPAFVKGVGARVYTIDNVVDRATGEHRYRYTSHQRPAEQGFACPSLILGGTGGLHLAKDRTWSRGLRRLVKAHDRGKVSDTVVADRFAALSYRAHTELRDGTVGPRCIVVWSRRRDAPPGPPGGSHRFYIGRDAEANTPAIPTIAAGHDVQALAGVLMAGLQEHLALHGFTGAPFQMDSPEVIRRLAELPSEPDEKLR